MALAPQSVYVSQAQQVQTLWNQFIAWYEAVQRINLFTTKNGAQNVWKAMATYAQTAAAGTGTADGTPVNTNPISVGNLGMTANDIINALNDMITIVGVFDGTVTAPTAIDHRGDAPSVTNLTG